MKTFSLIHLTLSLTVAFSLTAFAADKYSLNDFSINLEKLTTLPHHLWVTSGYTSVQPQYRTFSRVGDFFSPPFAARNFGLGVTVTADSAQITDDDGVYSRNFRFADGVWLPHKIVRYGTYHRLNNGKLISLWGVSELVPLFGQVGFVERITYTNRAETPVDLKTTLLFNPGNPTVVPLKHWGYDVPGSKTSRPTETAPGRWSNESVNVGLYHDNESGTVQPGESFTTTITVLMVEKDKPLPEKVDAEAFIKTASDAWNKRLERYTKNIPTLSSDIDGLDDYYKRSLMSGLVCIWENPAYAVNPHLSTCGIDGGAVCTYLWDCGGGYQPYLISMMLDKNVLDMAKKMVAINLEKYYAFTPDGSGVGVRYSYSTASFTSLVDAIFRIYGADKELYDYTKTLILNDEKRKSPNNLIDYGSQHNLLEMQGAGYEHFVVSPNAERSLCLKQLAEMGKQTGAAAEEINDWKAQGDKIIEAVRKELWDKDKQWFASLYPDGFKDYVHTIQVFDAMGAGACTPEMEKALISELNDKGYLGSCGTAAVAKSDQKHYEVLDTDWSGGGSYIGDGPQLALILYNRNYPKEGWDVLRRHFWMGHQFPYYPQEYFCDRPMAPPHTRANEISGLCGAEAILFGLIGFQPQYDGTLFINPQITVDGTINVNGFVYRNNTFDVKVSRSALLVRKNGKTIYDGKPERVKVL